MLRAMGGGVGREVPISVRATRLLTHTPYYPTPETDVSDPKSVSQNQGLYPKRPE